MYVEGDVELFGWLGVSIVLRGRLSYFTISSVAVHLVIGEHIVGGLPSGARLDRMLRASSVLSQGM